MTMHTDVQNVLDRLKTAQQKALGDPRFKSLIGLEKSTFSEKRECHLWAYLLRSGTWREISLSGSNALAQHDSPRFGQRRHPGRVAGDHRDQHHGLALRRFFGESRGGCWRSPRMIIRRPTRASASRRVLISEAQYAGQIDDVRAVGAKTGLEALMLGEEAMILGGCTSTPLGTTPLPTLAFLPTGGTLAAQTWSVICAALTLDGLMNGSIAGGVQGQITRTNADLSVDTFGGGVAKKSANATVVTTGATGSITASVTPVAGAMGYAWFWVRRVPKSSARSRRLIQS